MKHPVTRTNMNLFFLTGRQYGYKHVPWNFGIKYPEVQWSNIVINARASIIMNSDYNVRAILVAASLLTHELPVDFMETGEFKIQPRITDQPGVAYGARDQSSWSFMANSDSLDPVNSIEIAFTSDTTCDVTYTKSETSYTESAACHFNGELLTVVGLPDWAPGSFVIGSWEIGDSFSVNTPPILFPYADLVANLKKSEDVAKAIIAAGLLDYFHSLTDSAEIVGVAAASIMKLAHSEFVSAHGSDMLEIDDSNGELVIALDEFMLELEGGVLEIPES